jgi:2-polyprenyl-3-methyl-5-hydroxy-6-metoxy-1,4-benzoquinol methylase
MSSRPYFEIANPELPRLLQGLPRGLDVLDVACGSGVHGAELKRLYGHRVIGVDLSATSVEKAKTRLAEAYVADITHPELYPKFSRSKFDIIVLSDILEHVGDPLDVIARHLPFLAPGGYLLISLPNIAIWNVRFGLLFGRFEYQDTGTLDRTHMRFFTRGSLRQFLAEAGLEVRGSRITPGITRPFVPLVKRIYALRANRDSDSQSGGDSSSIMDSGPYRFYMRWLYRIEHAICSLWPGMFAFQLVTLAQPVAPRPASSSDADVSALANAVERRTEHVHR